MARCQHLPICKLAFDLTLHLEQVVGGLSGHRKHARSIDMRQGSRAVSMQVRKANHAAGARHRRVTLPDSCEMIDALPIRMMRVGKEVA